MLVCQSAGLVSEKPGWIEDGGGLAHGPPSCISPTHRAVPVKPENFLPALILLQRLRRAPSHGGAALVARVLPRFGCLGVLLQVNRSWCQAHRTHGRQRGDVDEAVEAKCTGSCLQFVGPSKSGSRRLRCAVRRALGSRDRRVPCSRTGGAPTLEAVVVATIAEWLLTARQRERWRQRRAPRSKRRWTAAGSRHAN